MQYNTRMTLVMGGRRSGKSAFAENLVSKSGSNDCIYIATAPHMPDDHEMLFRIAEHRQRRPSTWRTIEESYDIPKILSENSDPKAIILIDCLSLWVSNLLLSQYSIEKKTSELLEATVGHPSKIIFVSSEVGLSVVPDNPLSRKYADCLGALNQQIAKSSADVFLVIAGIAHPIKSSK